MRHLAFAFLLAGTALGTPLPSTQEVLRLAGKSVQKFWEQLSNVNCLERVQQVKFGPNQKPIDTQDSSFDYVVALQFTGNDILVQESRMPIIKAENRKNVPLLLTNGFSTLAFIFHPVFQSSFEFSPPAAVDVDGASLLEVHFRHVPGARSPSVLKLRNQEYPVDWQGTAWLEPASGAIVRISASLMPGLEDLGIKTLAADVRYSPVKFATPPEVYLLPSVATIEVETARQHWRNTHTFTRYKVFAVDVNTKTEIPK